ncbi:MAG: glycoside hydrolase family 130 protein [Acidobacteriota bacterium]
MPEKEPIPRLASRCILWPSEISPSLPGWEVVGAFNPGAAKLGSRTVLLVRVAERPQAEKSGWTGLPRWDITRGLVVDWFRDSELEWLDPRVVRLRTSGELRLTSVSHLRAFDSPDGVTNWRPLPFEIRPEFEWEEYGVEDARITPTSEGFLITYVAVSRHGAATALAVSEDLRSCRKQGIIFPPENKDVVIFPSRFSGAYLALHRPNPATHFRPPEIWLARSPDLKAWGQHEPFWFGRAAWESGRIGAGTPPLRLGDHWLVLYHGNRRPEQPGEVGDYYGAGLLLDARDPSRVTHYSPEPLLVPSEPWECEGFVPRVVFPTGIVASGDTLLVYYGAADTVCGVVRWNAQSLLDQLRPAAKDDGD